MRKRDRYVEYLSQVPLFKSCTKRELEMIARRGTDISVEAGREVVTQGKRGYEFFIIIEGKATVERDGEQVAVLGPGDFFGELALFENATRDATVTASAPMQIIVVSAQEFRALLEEAPGLTFRVMAGMARRLRELDTRVCV